MMWVNYFVSPVWPTYQLARWPEVLMSCDCMLTAIDRDDGPGDAARAVADQERSESADVGDVYQLVLRRAGGLRG